MTAIDKRALRDAFGTFPTGVTVVTARSATGEPVGFTANSFTSVSLDPPLLLACPARALSCFPVFEECERFAVNVLAENQEVISNIFAGFKGDRFAQVPWWEDGLGCPVLDGAAAQFSCTVHDRIAAGDHLILLGRVAAFDRSGARGLGYAGGGYFNLGPAGRAHPYGPHAGEAPTGDVRPYPKEASPKEASR